MHGDDWEWDDAKCEAGAQLVANEAIRHLPPSSDKIDTWGEPPAMPDALDLVVTEITRRRIQAIEPDKAEMIDHQQRANSRT